MSRKAGKEYQPEDVRTATFKLPHHKWEAFQAICKGQDRSASDVLLEFVESILNGGDIPGGGNEELGRFKEEMNAAIATINARLEALENTRNTKPRKPKPKLVQAEIIEAEPVIEPEPVGAVDPLTDADWEKLKAGLNQSQLAKRFGVRQPSVARQRVILREAGDIEKFKAWTIKHDPHGIAWQFESDEKLALLFPVL
jgi:hypothetical protein